MQALPEPSGIPEETQMARSLQQRLESAVQALHGVTAVGGQTLEDSALPSDRAREPLVPPNHLLPPDLDSYYHPRVSQRCPHRPFKTPCEMPGWSSVNAGVLLKA